MQGASRATEGATPWLTRLREHIERLMFGVSALSLFAMMLLVSADVIARYLLNSPLTFQFELTTDYLMVIVATLALPWAERHGAFIRLNIARRLLPPRATGYLDASNNLVAAAAFFALAWFSGVRTYEKWQAGAAIFGVIDWPVWLSLVWVPLGCFMLALRLSVNALDRVRKPLRETDRIESLEGSSQ